MIEMIIVRLQFHYIKVLGSKERKWKIPSMKLEAYKQKIILGSVITHPIFFKCERSGACMFIIKQI